MSQRTPHPLLIILALLALVASACTGSGGNANPPTTTSSTEVPITAEPLPDIDPAPSSPSGVAVVRAGDGAIELAWDASRDETVTGYEVTRVSPSGNTERFEVGVPSYLDRDVIDDEIYTYQIRAIGTGGSSEGSEAVTAQVGVDNNAPQAPKKPDLVESAAGVELSWSPVNDFSGIDNYIVTRTLDGESVELDAGPETTLTDDIAPGQIVSYVVRAVDGSGNASPDSRAITVLSGTAADGVIVVVSKEATPDATTETQRLERELLEAGFTMTWFEDDVFDANITSEDDIVLLLGDVEGEGFDWNVFATDASIVGLKSLFVEASGLTENPPKLDRLAQLDYLPPGKTPREVSMTTTGRPKPVVYIPPNEIIPSMQTWARPVWDDEIAVAGLIQKGDELANEKPARGCRAFFPGNAFSLAESTPDAWGLLIEFLEDISTACH